MLLALLGATALRAQEPEPKPDAPAPAPAPPAPPAPPAAAEAPKKKEPFFGDKFALYLEVRGGPASIDDVATPVTTTASSFTDTTVKFGSDKTGQFTVGWTLPRGRGQYLLTYNGVADGAYDLESTGFQNSYIDESGVATTPPGPLPWWHLSIHDGHLQSSRTPPIWNPATDDADNDMLPDAGEMRYPTTTHALSRSVPEDLGNQVQTWDLYYRREFGGVRVRARWTAGLRYLDYSGAFPVPAWLMSSPGESGIGFSDGVQNGVIIMQESTTGWGPVGSGEVQGNFFRQRLTLYGVAQAALLNESLEGDSGAFTYIARDPSQPNGLVGAGHIETKVSKSAWNTMFEVGVRFRVLEGFHVIADWNRTGYLDVAIMPTSLSIPSNSTQTALGTTARFLSREIVVSSLNLGLSFQF